MLHPWRADQEVARVLSEAFLRAPWTAVELLATGRRTVRLDSDWLEALVEEVLVLFPERPEDAPRALTDVIFYSAVFQQGAAEQRRRGTPLRAVIRHLDAGRTAPRWPVPAFTDVGALASWLELSIGQLMWLTDPGGYQLRTGPGPFHAYDYHWAPRSAAPPRLLEAPTPILKRVQRELLHRLLVHIPVHPAAHGFVAGRSVLTHARRHLGAQVVVSVDLQNFFTQISAARVRGLFGSAGYDDEVARCLTNLCVTRTPAWVLRGMPGGGSGDARYALRTALRTPHLAQGAPTSPMLANLACYHLDARLTGFADRLDAVYSRYADDLTLSGDARLRLASLPRLVSGLDRIVSDEGFSLNRAKTRVQGRAQRQVVTGVVVNERPNVPRQQYDQLRAVLHEARTRGPASANRSGRLDFRSHLAGRVEWVESVNPSRGRRLRADLDAISWPE